MKRFILKVIQYCLPVVLLFLITKFFYVENRGDLQKIGFILDNSDYRKIFKDEFEDSTIYYDLLSEVNFDKQAPKEYTVLTIGDSFSEQDHYGFKNYLGKKSGISVVHNNDFIGDNPIQELINIINGDILNHLKVDYILLENIERDVVKRNEELNWQDSMGIQSLAVKTADFHQNVADYEKEEENFFSDKILKVGLTNFMFFFQDKPKHSLTYKVKTNKELFTNKKEEVLFYYDDIKKLKINNDSQKVKDLNKTFNLISSRLKEKNIALIVMVAPDKYDLYYEDFKNKDNYEKPQFFNYLSNEKKQYAYIDAKAILEEAKQKSKDVYFYDDTHWSPKSAKIIANEIEHFLKHSQLNETNY